MNVVSLAQGTQLMQSNIPPRENGKVSENFSLAFVQRSPILEKQIRHERVPHESGRACACLS